MPQVGESMSAESFVLQACIAGIFATVVLDIWQRLLHAAAGIPPANWAFIGRWFAYIPRGRFVHRPIAATPAVRGELARGWTMHYQNGIAHGDRRSAGAGKRGSESVACGEREPATK